MLIGTVTGIDDGNIGHLGGISGRALELVAHHNQVDIVGDHLDGVLESLAL